MRRVFSRVFPSIFVESFFFSVTMKERKRDCGYVYMHTALCYFESQYGNSSIQASKQLLRPVPPPQPKFNCFYLWAWLVYPEGRAATRFRLSVVRADGFTQHFNAGVTVSQLAAATKAKVLASATTARRHVATVTNTLRLDSCRFPPWPFWHIYKKWIKSHWSICMVSETEIGNRNPDVYIIMKIKVKMSPSVLIYFTCVLI